MKPLVSVLIPAYNHKQYVGAAIESVLNQTYENFELLISDDCSTDGTRHVISSCSDARIKTFFFNENGGTVNSLNVLLEAAKGDYIAVLGSDDIWMPEKLEKQLEVMANMPDIAACFTYSEIIDNVSNTVTDSSVFPLDIFNFNNCNREDMLCRLFLTGNHFCHSSVLIRTCAHREIGEYKIQYRQLHDFDLWVRILLRYPVYIIEEKLVKYRVFSTNDNVSNLTQENNIRLFREARYIFKNMFNEISDADFVAGFKPCLVKSDAKTAEQIMCEKFFVLWNYSLWKYEYKLPALDYLMSHIDNLSFFECLTKEYNFSLNDIYKATGDYLSDCPKEFFQIDLNALESDCNTLRQELDNIHNSRMWKYYCILKKIKPLLRRKPNE